jgi:hypothetical protein
MGPREALERVSTLIRAGLASHEVEQIHALLQQMQMTAEKGLGEREVRWARVFTLSSRTTDRPARSRVRRRIVDPSDSDEGP